MSFFGDWKCPACGREWTGSIGWVLFFDLDERLRKICGCTGETLSQEDMDSMLSMSIVAEEGNAP